MVQPERRSFLKKRTKRLLLWGRVHPRQRPPFENKSFLLLFFKKEVLPSLP
jgi:hypothetical protein